MSDGPYNPLDKLNLGESIAQAFLRTVPSALSSRTHLIAAGVYALYYTGDFPAYETIAERNRNGRYECPIYVGKAVPKGTRKARFMEAAATGRALRNQLGKHAVSIREAENLNMEDFQYRSLVVDDVWIPLGESMLIKHFEPIWNVVIDGFGNNDPGKGRKKQTKSKWDILHPGRKIAASLPDGGIASDEVISILNAHFEGRQVAPLLEEADLDDEVDS